MMLWWMTMKIEWMLGWKNKTSHKILKQTMTTRSCYRPPTSLSLYLADYIQPSLWLWQLHQNENVGGIVGDEMGLGKTVQVAAFLGAAVASRKIKSVLIVAPGTLLEHWMREVAIWAPGLRRILARSSQPPSTNALHEWLQHARRERWKKPWMTKIGKSTNRGAVRGIVS